MQPDLRGLVMNKLVWQGVDVSLKLVYGQSANYQMQAISVAPA